MLSCQAIHRWGEPCLVTGAIFTHIVRVCPAIHVFSAEAPPFTCFNSTSQLSRVLFHSPYFHVFVICAPTFTCYKIVPQLSHVRFSCPSFHLFCYMLRDSRVWRLVSSPCPNFHVFENMSHFSRVLVFSSSLSRV